MLSQHFSTQVLWCAPGGSVSVRCVSEPLGACADCPAETSTASAAAVAGDGCKPFLLDADNDCIHELRTCDRFIIDGIITIPIALYGFFVFPNTPTTTSAFYLSEQV